MFIIPFYFSHCNKALSGLIYQDLLFFTSNFHRIQATHPFWKPDFYTSELMLQVVVNTINKYIYINHSHQFKKLEYSCTHIYFYFKTCNIVCACLYCKGRFSQILPADLMNDKGLNTWVRYIHNHALLSTTILVCDQKWKKVKQNRWFLIFDRCFVGLRPKRGFFFRLGSLI